MHSAFDPCTDGSWRTVAYQGVRLRIGPLAKLGCFKSTAENFLVYFVTISLASGPILSLTPWYTGVLYVWGMYHLAGLTKFVSSVI